MTETLNGKQRRALRALGHHLAAVVQVGKEGTSAALVAAVSEALDEHELIKLKVLESSPLDRHEVAETLAEQCAAEVAQLLGNTILLFKRNEEEPRIALPGMPLPPKERTGPGEGGRPVARRRKAPPRGPGSRRQ